MDNGNDDLPPYSIRKQRASNPYMPVIYALLLSFGIMLGFLVNSVTTGKQALLGGGYNKFDEILNYVSANYVDTLTRTELEDQTIDELLSNLDPHSVYIPKKDLSEVNEPLEGNFEGVGIEFFVVKDTILVVTAISGGPAETVGIKSGDRIVKINDTIVAGIKIKDTGVKQRLRGPKGTKVKVTVMRYMAKKLLDFEIERDEIPLYSIDAAYMLNSKTGYIRISTFSSTTYKEFVQKLQELKTKGMEKLVIDLRDNGGGYLLAATAIADELIAGDQLLVFTKGKTFKRQDHRSTKPGDFESGDVCVLINEWSASASEILAGAVQDLDRGTVIGRTSFGKGLVQEQFELKDGSAIRLTVARYYTPSGRSIQRSYDKGTLEYNREIAERYRSGEFVHGDSSVSPDTVVYKTSKGRIVTGGGGIHPDVFVALDTSSENDYFYAALPYLREFVYKYSSQNSAVLEKFKSPEDFKAKFTMTGELLKEFEEFAKAEGLKNGNGKEKSAIPKIKLYFRAFLAKQIWRNDGFYYLVNEDDKVIKKALEVLK